MQVDILNPLASFSWESCLKVDELDGSARPQAWFNHAECILFKDTLFTKIKVLKETSSDGEVLFAFTSDFSSWKELALPTEYAAFTHYCSQLVLVAGKELPTGTPTGKLWVSDDGSDWRPSHLPPLSIPRSLTTAVNTGSPEYLLVAGGMSMTFDPIDVVEVLVGEEWVACRQPLPEASFGFSSTLHNGSLFLVSEPTIRYCRLDSLLAACGLAGFAAYSPPEDMWRSFKTSLTKPYPVSYGRYLLMVGMLGHKCIEAYSPEMQEWVRVGTLPNGFLVYYISQVIPTREILVFGGNPPGVELLKASVKREF